MVLSQVTAIFLFLGQRQFFEGELIPSQVSCSLNAQQKRTASLLPTKSSTMNLSYFLDLHWRKLVCPGEVFSSWHYCPGATMMMVLRAVEP